MSQDRSKRKDGWNALSRPSTGALWATEHGQMKRGIPWGNHASPQTVGYEICPEKSE